MGASPTLSANSALPSFKNFSLNEVPWWLVCCRVFVPNCSWRQVPVQVRFQEVEKAQGERPAPPLYPPEPLFLGDPTDQEARASYQADYAQWHEKVQDLDYQYQQDLMWWNMRGMNVAQKWDLAPTPELTPYDSRPPELREWLPVDLFESRVVASQKAQRVPTTARNWHRDEDGEWQEVLQTGTSWTAYGTEELQRVLQGEDCIHLPETLILAVPGEHFPTFLAQLDRQALVLVRCRWDSKARQLVSVGSVPQVFLHPVLEIVSSLALLEPGVLPLKAWPGVPEALWKSLSGWEAGQQVPATRAQFAVLEEWVSRQPRLPSWYVTPEYRAAAAVNLCCQDAVDSWGPGYLWRPLLPGEAEAGEGWMPTL
ncbi:hypothetical protein [Holophaga foetida]|uniref:hypothetical protein n=1 Tax=Holophaga foetida TaxID=35839 RepID=UPI00024742AD|nr:hypothetical protein [Holophaga foetida]